MYIVPSKKALFVYRVGLLAMIFVGATISVPIVWELADLFSVIMTLLNLIGILLLATTVVRVIKDYEKQLCSGIRAPIFKKDE